MNCKEYTLPNGKKAMFEYDFSGIGKVTLECMDMLMAMIADRPQGEWIFHSEWEEHWCRYECSLCGRTFDHEMNYCGFCGARMIAKDTNVPK